MELADQTAAVETPETGDPHFALWQEWKNTGDQNAFNELYRGVEKIGRKFARQYMSSLRKNPRDIFNEICVSAIFKALDSYDPLKSNGKKVSSWVAMIVEQQLIRVYTRYKRKEFKEVSFVSEEDKDNDVQGHTIERLRSNSRTPEELLAERETGVKLRANIGLAVATALSEKQRRVMEAFILDPDTSLEGIGETLDCSGENVRLLRDKAFQRLQRALQVWTEDGDLDAREDPFAYLATRKFPELDPELAFHELKAGGVTVEFRDHQLIIDMRDAGSNRANVQPFTQRDGSRIPGYELLLARGEIALPDVFSSFRSNAAVQCIAPASEVPLFKRPRRAGGIGKKDTAYSADEIYAAVRALPNLIKMMELFDIEFTDEGRWSVSISSKAFSKPWFALNGGALKGGGKLCQLLGLPSDQKGIRCFAGKVFGEDKLDFHERKPGPPSTKEVYRPEQLMAFLRSNENEAMFAQWGITFEGDVCHIRTPVTAFGDNARFIIDGSPMRADTIFKALGDKLNQPGLIKLCKKLFPRHRVVCWVFPNGNPVERTKGDQYIKALRDDMENRRKLRNLAPWKNQERCHIGMFDGARFTVDGKLIGMRGILNELNAGEGPDDIRWLYDMIFPNGQSEALAA